MQQNYKFRFFVQFYTPIHTMKRLLILLFFVGMTGIVMAVTPEEMADTLTSFAQAKASVARVTVKSIRVKGQNVIVTTNPILESLSLSPQDVKELREKVSMMTLGHKKGKVTIYTNGQEIGTLITCIYQSRPRSDRHILKAVDPLVKNNDRAYTAGKGLDGKHIALWGSHGLYYVQDYQMWKWQRARLWTTVEDLYTSSYTRTFLVPMLENAGCVVIQPRERDIQKEEVIVDDSDINGNHNENNIGWGRKNGPLLEGENPFTMGDYSIVYQDMIYTPTLPQEGDYAVYVSYATTDKSTNNAQYTIVHNGISTQYEINQQMGGGTWVYVGTFHFGTTPGENYVRVKGKQDGSVSSDAIKFGGGMGSVARYPQPNYVAGVASALGKVKDTENQKIDSTQLRENQKLAMVSGWPRYIEGARYWLQYSGIPDSVYNYTESRNDYIDDYACRGRWVNYLAGGSEAYKEGPGLKIPVNLSMAFHSDAGTWLDDTQVGTLAVYTPEGQDHEKTYAAGGSRMCNRDLADLIQTQIVNDIRATTIPTWPRRRLWNSSYAESRNPKVPCALLELLSHQNYADMVQGLNPEFKFIVSRAIYKAFLKFLHEQDGTPYVVQPLPVKNFAIQRKSGNEIELIWEEQVDSLEKTANPTYYIVYAREEGKDWDNGKRVRNSHYTLHLKEGIQYDFRIAAGNDGGQSLNSETLTAYIANANAKTALIINGFTRVAAPEMMAWDSITGGILPYSHAISYGTEISYLGEQFNYNRMDPWHSDDDCGFGMNFADHAKEVNKGNTYDYPVMHGNVLKKMGLSFVSCSMGFMENQNEEAFNSYDLVDVILGKEKGNLMPAHFRAATKHYLDNGGNMLIAGSYVTTAMKSEADTAFMHQTLKYIHKTSMASNAGRFQTMYNVLTNRTYHWEMVPNERIIECEAPDGIDITNGSVRIGRYEDNGVCAGIAYDKQLIVLPMMLESVVEFKELYTDCVKYLVD